MTSAGRPRPGGAGDGGAGEGGAGDGSAIVGMAEMAPVTPKRMSANAASAIATPAHAPFTAAISGNRSPSCQATSASNSGRTP